MSLLLFFTGGVPAGPIKFPPIAPPITVTIDGINRTGYTRAVQSLRIEYTMGGRTVLSCETVDHPLDTSTAYRPAVDQSITIVYDGRAIFSGTILGVEDRALGDPSVGVVVRISATSMWRAAASRLIARALPAGWTLKMVVTDLMTNYLVDYGMSLDPTMASGPTMDALTFDYITVEEAFNRLSDLTGWVYRLTPANVVQWFAIGTSSVGVTFSAANANILGGVTWAKSRDRYVNRQFVRYGPSEQLLKTDTFIGDGVLQSWPLRHPGLLTANGFIQSRGLVNVDGTDWPLGWYGVDATAWQYDPGSNGLYIVTAPPAAGSVIQFTYMVQFPLITYAENSADIALRGAWDDIVNAPTIVDKVEAESAATALLRRYSALPRELHLKTRAAYVLPGDTVAVTLPARAISASDWLVTAVTMFDEVDQAISSHLTLLEGTEAQASWIEFWQHGLGSHGTTGSSGGTITGAIVPTQGSQFESDVIARVGDDGIVTSELALRGNVSSASYAGPALTLGRLASPLAWSMVGDQLHPTPEIRGLYFVPMAERNTTRYAMALTQAFTGGSDGAYFLVPNGGAGGVLYLGGPTSAFGPGYRVSLYSTNINNAAAILTDTLSVTGGLTEHGRTAPMGDWTEVPFNAGNFTASGAMTVTLTATDQVRYRWMRVGSTAWIELTLKTMTLGGTPSDQVRVTLPAGLVAATSEQWGVYHYVNNGTQGIGLCGCGGGGQAFVQFYIQPFATSWAAATNASEIRATLALEVL